MALTVIVPARNEEGNLTSLIERLIVLPMISEIIICEGNSSDNTWKVAEDLARIHSPLVRAIKQSGKHKFDAVLCALDVTVTQQAMIWDADQTVSLLDQVDLISSALSHPDSLWTGDRLKGKREPKSMRFPNLVGNHLFAIFWRSWFSHKFDTLCGSKIFPTKMLRACPESIKSRDPFGDFSLIASAYFSGLPVRSTPVHYLSRTYGNTNIHRWVDGMKLLKICIFFIYEVLRRRYK